MAELSLAGQQYRALLELRWTLYWRSLRGIENKVLLGAAILFRILMLLVGLGIGGGLGFLTYQGLAVHKQNSIATVFWILFLVWQGFVLLRASLSHNVGRDLLRFPMTLRTYVTLWTLSGLTDISTMIGLLSCIGIAIGAEAAGAPILLSLLVPATFFVLNVALSRAIFLWLERALANRRMREVVLILLSTMGLVPQFLRVYSGSKHVHLPAWLRSLMDFFPPSFATHALWPQDRVARQWGSMLELLACCVLLLALCGYRLLQEYRGEDLHDGTSAHVAMPERRATRLSHGGAKEETQQTRSLDIAFTIFQNEFAKLRHSGMAVYQIVAPLLFILLFGARIASKEAGWLIPGGMLYLSIDLIRSYNMFGTDGPGFQIFRLAPISMRDVYLGKNLFVVCTFVLQILMLLGMGAYYGSLNPASLAFVVGYATVSLGIHLTLANTASLRSARRLDNVSKMLNARKANRGASGAGGWRGLVAMLGIPGVVAGLLFAGVWLHSPWVAPGVLLVCAVPSAWWYWHSLKKADAFDPQMMEKAVAMLSKTA